MIDTLRLTAYEAARLLRNKELTGAELDRDRARGDRDDGDADERLRGARERLEVDRGDEPVDAEELLPGADRGRVVFPGPVHGVVLPGRGEFRCLHAALTLFIVLFGSSRGGVSGRSHPANRNAIRST